MWIWRIRHWINWFTGFNRPFCQCSSVRSWCRVCWTASLLVEVKARAEVDRDGAVCTGRTRRSENRQYSWYRSIHRRTVQFVVRPWLNGRPGVVLTRVRPSWAARIIQNAAGRASFRDRSSEPATAACDGSEVGDARCCLGRCTDRLRPLFSRKIEAFAVFRGVIN